MTGPNAPYALADSVERDSRTSRLHETHVATLTDMVIKMRKEKRPDYFIPNFDPCDGGINSRVLILMEAPGPKAMASGFVSRNNPDPTASNLCKILHEAQIPRRDTVIWNVVPWYLGDGKHIHAAKPKDLAEARADLEALFNLLNVEAVVLLGKKAQAAYASFKTDNFVVHRTHHPSAQVLNIRPHRRDEILNTFRKI